MGEEVAQNATGVLEHLPETHVWRGPPAPDDLKPLPGVPAVYLFVDDAGRPVQLLTTQALRRVATSRLTDPERPKRGREDLAALVRGVRWRPVASPFEARWWYWRLARRMYPREYRKLVSFGPAWFLHVDWQRPIPEIRISERAWRDEGEFVGPWPSRRQAQEALDGLLDLFDLCRYAEQVRKAPHGQRCTYAEMGRCDAPCDGSVPLETYERRNRAAWAFAGGAVADWIDDAEQRMRGLAGELAFERAGILKAQLEFARQWRSKWLHRVRPLEQFNFLLALPVTRRKAWKLFLLRAGAMDDGPTIPQRKLVQQTPEWLRERLAVSPPVTDKIERMEQTWLVSHLLENREARGAIIIELHDVVMPPALDDVLTQALEARASSAPPAEVD
ncbi:MAG: hypothetical protein JXO22_05285 [Phycisphaerae bacterium]|nr:hypothetical protein [Phycisphaerae bacterium]